MRISCHEMSCRLDNPCSVSPAMNSWATWRLNSMLWERCLITAFILRKPSRPCQFFRLNRPGPRGALQKQTLDFFERSEDARSWLGCGAFKHPGKPVILYSKSKKRLLLVTGRAGCT